MRQLTLYTPERRRYPALPAELRKSYESIPPSIYDKHEYRPCSVTLKDGKNISCAYVMDAQSFIEAWGVWPEDNKGVPYISIADIAQISESFFRLPPKFANEIYRAGESGMGYCIFTLVFSNGSEQAYVSGNAVDFVYWPAGRSAGDVVKVIPHKGRDASPMQTPEYSWCLFGDGSPPLRGISS